MAGQATVNELQLGNATDSTKNFVLKTNADGSGKLARGNVGATTQDIISWDASGKVSTPQNARTWQNMNAARTMGTSYQNTTGQEIRVKALFTISTGPAAMYAAITINGTPYNLPATYAQGAGYQMMVDWDIPAGATYSIAVSSSTGAMSQTAWMELR